MENTLVVKSGIIKLKSKFFLYRALIYCFFLSVPLLVNNYKLPWWSILVMVISYLLFIGGQWYLLGKEFDHRIRIFFGFNSTTDRLVYRLHTGLIFFIFYFYIVNFLPQSARLPVFWGSLIGVGLFYSWPTRGKIIEESLSGQLQEFRFLDSFERTLLGLIVFIFFISLPEIPPFESVDAVKLFIDPNERISGIYWNLLKFIFLPFHKSELVIGRFWYVFMYYIPMGLNALTCYSLFRYIFSRRLSMLGIFSVLSSWMFSKILGNGPWLVYYSSLAIVWIWALSWSAGSKTYKSGLFLGLLSFYSVMIEADIFPILIISFIVFYKFYLYKHNLWYRNQLLKYALPGLVISCTYYLLFRGNLSILPMDVISKLLPTLKEIVTRKAFFSLSIIGIFLLILQLTPLKMKTVKFNKDHLFQILISFGVVLISCLVFSPIMLWGPFFMLTIALLSCLPIEYIFQSISRLRSKRNFLYLIYILVCVLDSHLEGRIKIMFNNLFLLNK